ncbi:MAG: DUF4242 domain-containing protein [Gammaproteobacteria bacterium]|jgi:hypothetical protein
MTLLVLERHFDPALTREQVIEMAMESGWCFQTHRVEWHGSMLSADGHSMVCQFEAADAESIRLALRQLGCDTSKLWRGTVHEAPGEFVANVIVERDFADPVDLDALQAQEDAKQWCLDTYDVKFVRTLESADKKRLLCLYCAPDAEAVRSAQQQAGMPFTRIWSFTRVDISDLAT